MYNLVVKIKKALAEIEAEKGNFTIKCLVAKNPDDIQWDLVLAADWFEADKMKRLEYLASKIFKDFDADSMSQFSAIITLDAQSNTELVTLLKRVQDNYSHGVYKNIEYYDDGLFVIVETKSQFAHKVLPLDEYATAA